MIRPSVASRSPMRRFARHSIRLIGIALFAASVPATVLAQAPKNRPLLPGEQWVQLFNGKDLAGWVEVGKEKWTVEDGVIHGQGVSNAYGYLRTEKKYKDFWLSLRFKCEADGNSGVYIHTEFKEGTVDVSQGKQFEIDRVLNHHTGGLYGEGRGWYARSEEHTSELQSPCNLVCRLLLEKKNTTRHI